MVGITRSKVFFFSFLFVWYFGCLTWFFMFECMAVWVFLFLCVCVCLSYCSISFCFLDFDFAFDFDRIGLIRFDFYLIVWLISELTDWLIDWLIHWLIDSLIDWLIDGLMDWLIGWSVGWLIGWLVDWLIDYWFGLVWFALLCLDFLIVVLLIRPFVNWAIRWVVLSFVLCGFLVLCCLLLGLCFRFFACCLGLCLLFCFCILLLSKVQRAAQIHVTTKPRGTLREGPETHHMGPRWKNARAMLKNTTGVCVVFLSLFPLLVSGFSANARFFPFFSAVASAHWGGPITETLEEIGGVRKHVLFGHKKTFWCWKTMIWDKTLKHLDVEHIFVGSWDLDYHCKKPR